MKCGTKSQDILVKFDLKYLNGFEMDKKWVDEWQKLPYISPYENVKNIPSKSDEDDKWAVIILHEILSLCVGKKTKKDNLLFIAECLGLRSRFKRELMLHPGIFYVSRSHDLKKGDAPETDADMEEEEKDDDEDSDVYSDYHDEEMDNEDRDVKHSQRLNLRKIFDDRKPS
ncbi:hypothetical protein CQW23_10187 [Capsicum baccatum]|uniref:PORR domain-containing protein n=1 Tax=Capsicum baccatum TaxID=33114 RepID=A0A2G2WZ13_CAPBA|nr:hypothetical protein CQW23_10187 [Capsicum baccatum]